MPEKITADSVETQELRLVNSEGQVRGMLRVNDEDAPSLKLVDGEGNVRVVLAVQDEGKAGIQLSGSEHPAVSLTVDQHGAAVCVHDNRGQVRIKAEVSELQSPRVEFYNASGLMESTIPVATSPTLRT